MTSRETKVIIFYSEQGLKLLGVDCNLQIMTPQDRIIVGIVKILLDVMQIY